MNYEESKFKAFTLVEDIKKNRPDFLNDAAKKVITRHKLWNVEAERLNPPMPESCWKEGTVPDPNDETGKKKLPVCEIPKDWKRKQPSIVHPYLCLNDKIEKGKVILPTFSNSEDTFIVSAGIVLALHDLWPVADKITTRIWPPDFLDGYNWAFNPLFGDKTSAVEAAIRNVEAALPDVVLPIYSAIDVATRTITIGEKSTTITSEIVWEFIKDLITASKADRLVPRYTGKQDNKNNVDRLRLAVGKDNLKKLIISTGDGYKLSPDVKLLNSGQIGIRKTK
jgi:hypothetical protein